jgi:2,3-diketo-5-methylthio-1-phosphopentane phosphatase
MMDSVTKPYPECIQYLVDNIKLDPGFAEFFEWSLENNVPVVVLSSGMVPIIKALLTALVGPNSTKMLVIANDVGARPGKTIDQEGGWQIVFHDESDFGHDKSLNLRPYAQLPKEIRPTMFYAGDGVSDISAAKETDLLFAKKGHGEIVFCVFFDTCQPIQDLVSYCVKDDIPFTLFEDWSSILAKTKEIV